MTIEDAVKEIRSYRSMVSVLTTADLSAAKEAVEQFEWYIDASFAPGINDRDYFDKAAKECRVTIKTIEKELETRKQKRSERYEVR